MQQDVLLPFLAGNLNSGRSYLTTAVKPCTSLKVSKIVSLQGFCSLLKANGENFHFVGVH